MYNSSGHFYVSTCDSKSIVEIVYRAFEIKLTIISNLFKNDCLFMCSIQQRNKLKYIDRLPEFRKFFILIQSFSFDG